MKTCTPLTTRLIAASFCFLWLNPLSAQLLTGNWYAKLPFPDDSSRVVLQIVDQGGAFEASISNIDKKEAAWAVDELGLSNGQLSLRMVAGGMTYLGTIDESSSYLSGNLTKNGQNYPLRFQRKKIDAPIGSEEWFKERLIKRETLITMRDGVRLFTSYYIPKDASKKYPILLHRTPYNAEPSLEGYNVGILDNLTHLIEAGYIVAIQDVRGRQQSEGFFEDVRPHKPIKKGPKDADESTDTYDAIEWLVKNVPNNNGRVGVLGVSYPGFYSTMALIDAHPALKAVSPQAPVTDWFIGDDFHHNGAFFMMDAFSFFSGFGVPRPVPTRAEKEWGFKWPNEDNYQFFLDLGPVRNVKTKYFADSIRFWNEVVMHPNYDDYWKARNPRPHLKNIKPAVLTVGGWFDAEDCFGPLRVYEAIEKQNPDSTTSNRLVMGPWSHGQWAKNDGASLGNIHFGAKTSEYYRKIELEFFEYHLKNKGEFKLAEATIFLTGSNEWRNFEAWPPKNTEKKSLYFQPAGGLSFEAPSDTLPNFEEYMSDPNKPVPYAEDVHQKRTIEYMTDDQRFAARRPDVMVYQTIVLEEDITLTGPLTADLWVSTTGTDADYVVKLIDVFPDTLKSYPKNDKEVPMAGYQMLVRGEVLRGRFRNSFETPEPFVPGEVTEVKFELPDVAHTFQKGHRIMIQVQNSWFPLVDRNPQKFVDIYHCGPEDFQKAIHRIYQDKGRASKVEVMVLK